jgi:hypothetical protein
MAEEQPGQQSEEEGYAAKHSRKIRGRARG